MDSAISEKQYIMFTKLAAGVTNITINWELENFRFFRSATTRFFSSPVKLEDVGCINNGSYWNVEVKNVSDKDGKTYIEVFVWLHSSTCEVPAEFEVSIVSLSGEDVRRNIIQKTIMIFDNVLDAKHNKGPGWGHNYAVSHEDLFDETKGLLDGGSLSLQAKIRFIAKYAEVAVSRVAAVPRPGSPLNLGTQNSEDSAIKLAVGGGNTTPDYQANTTSGKEIICGRDQVEELIRDVLRDILPGALQTDLKEHVDNVSHQYEEVGRDRRGFNMDETDESRPGACSSLSDAFDGGTPSKSEDAFEILDHYSGLSNNGIAGSSVDVVEEKGSTASSKLSERSSAKESGGILPQSAEAAKAEALIQRLERESASLRNQMEGLATRLACKENSERTLIVRVEHLENRLVAMANIPSKIRALESRVISTASKSAVPQQRNQNSGVKGKVRYSWMNPPPV